jgi:Zn-dependent protease
MPDSTALTFSCSHCGQTLSWDPSAAGSQIHCPACHQPIHVPHPSNRDAAFTSFGTADPKQFSGSAQETKPRSEGLWRKALLPFGVLLLALGKFKILLLPFLKFFPVLLKTGGTMLLTIWAYALSMGWRFALGFVLLIFVHECGHLLAAKRLGLKVGAPVFIPFMGAFIALKDAPRNAWIEAQVGIGGPLLGAAGAALCLLVYWTTQSPLFGGLAYSGFVLNLFNLAPVGFLDGGRIVTALSPWLWIVGLAVIVLLLFAHPNFLLVLILLFSLPRVFSLFRRRTAEEARYFEVTPGQRWIMGALYFGLVVALFAAMHSIQP